jgi:hypothetical protein
MLNRTMERAVSNNIGTTKTAHYSGQKKWQQPILRKLPIRATANTGSKQFNNGNEGTGGGKGDANTIS